MAVTFANRHHVHALAAPDDKAFVEYWHEFHAGFGVRVMRPNLRNGRIRRSYLVRYTDAEGKDKKVVLGLVEELGFEEALQEANNRRMLARHYKRTGEQPLPTLGEAFERYLEAKAERLTPTTVKDYRKRFDSYLQDRMFDSVASLSPDVLRNLYEDLLNTHGRPTAGGVARLLHAICQMLVDGQLLVRNPVASLKPYGIFERSEPRQSYIKKKDLPKVWAWLHTHPAPGVRDFMLVELFTGYRLAIVGQLRWSNFDGKTGRYLVPAEERGNKAKKEMWMPLPDYLLEKVIEPRYNARGSEDWIIPSHKKLGSPLVNVRGSFGTMAEATGVRVGSHDVRRTFATIGAAVVKMHILARLMTHSTRPNVGAYQQTSEYAQVDDEEMREAINRIATSILEHATKE